MDPERVRFVFGTPDPGFDVDDEDELIAFFEAERATEQRDAFDDVLDDEAHEEDEEDEDFNPRALVRTIVARQILHDEPAEVWQTVQRLRVLGLERSDVLDQMAIALTRDIQRALADERDSDMYLADLARLPVASAPDIVD